MKHKLTVLACVGLALLLSTGFAFAQANTITIETKNVYRCSDATVGINLINGDAINGIGLPLKVTGGTVTAAAATARLAGWTLAQNGLPGASFVLNALQNGGVAMPAGAGNIYTLTVPIPSACQGTIEIDTAFFAPAGVVMLLSGCCPVDYVFNKGVLTPDDQQPTCGNNLPVTLDWQSAIVDKLLLASDPDACDGLVYSLVSSPGSIAAGTNKYSWDPNCADVATSPHTITFKATDPCGEFATCTFVVTVTQQGPVCTPVPAQSVHFNGTLSVLLPATDDGCPSPLQWTLLTEDLVGAVTINQNTGLLTYIGKCADIATSPHIVTYKVSDGVKICESSVSITVTNTAPTLVCPSPIDPAHLCNNQLIDGGDGIFNIGDLVTGTAVGADLNGDALTYSVVSISGPVAPHNAPTIDPNTGAFSWQTSAALPSEVGTWTIVLAVSDGCATVTCSFQVTLEFTFYVGITNAAGTSDQIHVLNGQVACVYITIGPDYPLGGLDLLLAYDVTAIAFLQPAVAMGDLAEWEYFTYRTGANGNCGGGGCPTGLIRIIAIADLDNGPLIHPLPSEFGLEGQVVKLCFTVTADRNFIGQCIPIYWYTVDCGDNVLASKDGYTTFVEIGTDTAACAVNEKPGHFLIPIVHFCDGWICIDEPPDDRGDINLDGVANSIADAVLFSRYFIYGIDEFMADPALRAVQLLATDVNDDGVVLTVADLVYLVRIITGDAQPFPAGENPKLTPYQNHADAVVNVGANRVSVTTNSAVDLGGAVFTFRYSGLTVGDAVLGNAASQMVVKSNANRGELRVLVAPPMDAKGARINAGINELVSIPTTGEGTIELVSVEISDAQGALLSTNLSKNVPSEYALLQNYPNPFNAGTVIQFSLKDQADWKLSVYNITGQTVRSFSGNGTGQIQVAWDGSDNAGNAIASGVYFYRLETKAFTATKKMTLMK